MHWIQKKLLEASTKKSFSNLTLRGIGELIGLNHPQLIKHHLSQLVKKGLLGSKYQSLKTLQSQGTELLNVPVLGSANCGEATLLAEENLEGYLKVSSNLLPVERTSELFALKAVGNSMNKARVGKNSVPIEDGDYAIVDKGIRSAKNGDYVVSIIDGAANIKQFFLEKQKEIVYLISESTDDYPPIVIKSESDFFVNGRVIEVVKLPSKKVEK